ncbi:unnamed protein product [Rotaria magnacalcarata]|uniref:Uncharacterized protein n=2 Tax=Rotaria magnacalcarata TaxID=392030 RepID=A0A816MM78_9BILA|nr:unnamed protein product [Rotaria magnacalcarata]CAF2006916.1 unnamed protein product [Rotaria magnacalcarata]CAF4240690.1 unnamed protein product [Rotaria magnacalcarata]
MIDAESAPITDTTFWTFNIWDPSVSSTTTTTTTPPTTHTVTTRTISLTTVNTLLTTTGIAVTSATMPPNTTTTTTTTISTATTTSVTVITTTQQVTDMMIITPQDFETACTQPVAIVTTLLSIAMVPVHIVGLFTLFTKVNKTFNPNFMRAKLRHNERIRRVARGGAQ